MHRGLEQVDVGQAEEEAHPELLRTEQKGLHKQGLYDGARKNDPPHPLTLTLIHQDL